MPNEIQEATQIDRRRWIYRHRLPVRLNHWINVICLTVLLMSGLQIFNAHPALYFGAQSDFDNPVLSISSEGENPARGVTKIGGKTFDTTGWLGVSQSGANSEERAFPAWSTIPGPQNLATGRQWHFFFAWIFVVNGLFYLIYSIVSGHFRHDFIPTLNELKHIGKSILEHAMLRFPKGEEAKHYNVLQKLTYLAIVFAILPVMVLAGLTMSPGINAAAPFLIDLFGGRQSARTVHFILAWTIVAFVFVHVLMVIVSGFWNNIRSMVTGRYVIEKETEIHDAKV